MSKVSEAAERVMQQARGASGFILLQGVEGVEGDAGKMELIEHVMVRRSDIELLLATWREKKA